MSKNLVVGVGNTFRRDDGFGPEVIKNLHALNFKNVDLLDVGLDDFLLLDSIQKPQRALIVDAVRMGSAPGTVKVFAPREVLLKVSSDSLSTHGLGLAWILKLKEKLGITTELLIVGIEPKNIFFGEGLSEEVSEKIEYVIKIVKDFVLNRKIYQ